MQPITTVRVMRESDAMTIREGTSGRELMRRAGEAIYRAYPWKGKTAIVCGSGNNAGDGYVLAALLWQDKIACELILLGDTFSEDGGYYYGKCKEIGVPTRSFDDQTDFSEYTEIVDCIFGTGFHGEVRGVAADAISRINASGKVVISVDINSGLNGDNGRTSLCIRSDLTLSIGFYQPGHFLGSAKDVIGRLLNLDIGIGLHGDCFYLVEEEDFGTLLAPRPHDSHKGSYGYVALLGGCRDYAGAVKLANLSCSALRAGCGVARLIVPESVAPSVAPYLLESTLSTLPDQKGHMIFDRAALDAALGGQRALAIGMGWGRSSENELILTHVLECFGGSIVIDADGLNTLAELDPALLKSCAGRVILTPHPKEMERLSGIPIREILEDPIAIATDYAKSHGVCVLLKGSTTVVTDGNETYLVNRGCAGMATAGSGDVLSGILVGLLGHLPPSPLTAACGAYLAGLAGELAERDLNPISMLASDTVGHIGQAVSQMMKKR